MRLGMSLLAAVGMSFSPGVAPPPAQPGPRLWAAITASEPVYKQGEKLVMIHFAVVNDGDRVVNPEIGHSQLFINGKELEDWPFTASNGPRDNRFEALPPGERILLGVDMSRYFQEPGVYKVLWNGKFFQAPEIVFRVLPRK